MTSAGAGITYYQLLGVAPHASTAEIKRAYHELARTHHPDARPFADEAGAERARRIMAEVNDAWAVLGDPPRRRAYDTQIGLQAQERESSRWAPLESDANDDDSYDPLLEEDYEAAPAGPADLIVLVPVGVLALAVASFVLSVLSQSPFWMWVSIVLVPIAAVAFVATPLAVMLIRLKARSRT